MEVCNCFYRLSSLASKAHSDPVWPSDGGEWVFALNLFERYGLVPQALYPESWSSSSSAKMNELVNTKVSVGFSARKRCTGH